MKKFFAVLLLIITVTGCSLPSVDLTEPTDQTLTTLDPLDAPFVVQAPFGEWDDPIQQDACEEASVIMAIMWTQGIETISKDVAKATILSMADYQTQNFGSSIDTSSRDTLERLIQGYYNYESAFIKEVFELSDLTQELDAGNLILIAVDGRKLNNPNFSGEGPDKHMLVIKGYDASKEQFITNDPGTRNGENYKYSYDTIMNSLQNYQSSGNEAEVNEREMIVIKPSF